MSGISLSDRNHCEKISCIPGSVFSTSFRFARPSFRDRLVSVHAFYKEITDIPFAVSDPGVARLKIAWWGNELLTGSAACSQHPVVRALSHSGTLEIIDKRCLEEYFFFITELACGDSIGNLAQLEKLTHGIGGREVLIENLACGGELDSKSAEAIGSASMLNRCLYRVSGVLSGENWWMPLDLQARHGITLASVGRHETDKNLDDVIRQLSELALESLTKGIKTITGKLIPNANSDGIHHLLIKAAIIRRRLARLTSNPGWHRKDPSGIGEVYTAWKQAIKGRIQTE